MTEHNITSTQVSVAALASASTSHAAKFNSIPEAIEGNIYLRNLWTMAQLSTRVASRAMILLSEQVTRPIADHNMPLFEFPEDNAIGMRHLADFFDTLRTETLGDYGQEIDLPAAVKSHVFMAQDDTVVTIDDVQAVFPGPHTPAVVRALIWAGEITAGVDDATGVGRLHAPTSDLSLDVKRMLRDHPEIGEPATEVHLSFDAVHPNHNAGSVLGDWLVAQVRDENEGGPVSFDTLLFDAPADSFAELRAGIRATTALLVSEDGLEVVLRPEPEDEPATEDDAEGEEE